MSTSKTDRDVRRLYTSTLDNGWERIKADDPVFAYHDELRFNIILKMLKTHKDNLVLDIGCGTGVLLEKISKVGAKGVGVDISFPNLRKAKERLEKEGLKPLLLIADAYYLPFKADSFDKIVATEVIEHLEAYEILLLEAKRVGKSDATLVFTVPNLLYPWRHFSTLKEPGIWKRIKALKSGVFNEKYWTFSTKCPAPIHWTFKPSTFRFIVSKYFKVVYLGSTLKWLSSSLSRYKGENKLLKFLCGVLKVIVPPRCELKIARTRLFSSDNALNRNFGAQLVVVAKQRDKKAI